MGRLEDDLEKLKARNAYRALSLPVGRDFTSNDYLGFSRHPKLIAATIAAITKYGTVGAGGSRLLRGHHEAHAALEDHAARFFATDSALYFGSGFSANFALFTTLPQRHDAVIFDERIHASVREGIHAGKADAFRALHNDVNSFADAIARARANGAGKLWIAVESVYSMDGDLAPLKDLHELARTHDAELVVDEAHATGIFGLHGRGLSEGLVNENIITVHTCGKALGVVGALICGSRTLRDYLINTARPFIYATAPPPHLAAAVSAALDLVDSEPGLRATLLQRAAFAAAILRQASADAARGGNSHIIPIILGEEARTLRVAENLRAAGFDLRAVRPPTVAKGTARLRVSLNVGIGEADITALGETLAEILRGNP